MSEIHSALNSYRSYLARIAGMQEDTWNGLKEALQVITIDKGAYLLKEGAVCNQIYFLYKGSFRAYFNKDGEESTTGLFLPEMCFTNMKSISTLEPSHLAIHALEPGIVVQLSKQDMISLYQNTPTLESVGRMLLESMLVAENEWKEMHTIYKPEERYAFLMSKYPRYVQQIPLQYIASFLGIRRETLSRIRGRHSRKSF